MRVQRGHHQHVRVPLDHDVRVVGQPDRAVRRQSAVAIAQHRLVPAAVGRRARRVPASRCRPTVCTEWCLPNSQRRSSQVTKSPSPGWNGPDVVVLQVDLDEGLPVVVALVHLHLIEHVAAEVEIGARRRMRASRAAHVAPVVLEDQAVPVVQRVVVQVQAGVGREVRCADQLAVQVVGPAVQRADDVVARLPRPRSITAWRWRQTLDISSHAVRRAHQRAAFAFLRQGVVVARLRAPHSSWPSIARPGLEDQRASRR